MAADSFYLIGFFSYFGLESQKPELSVLFDVLRSLQSENPDMDVSMFEQDARQLMEGMNGETISTIQDFLDEGEGCEPFMNGWRVAHLYDMAASGSNKTLH